MRVAIIGSGVVGATAAFYLNQNNIEVDLYDDNHLGGTKAAVGIICPWVSQRRNMTWYTLVEEGAKFYQQLVQDLNLDSFITRNGAIIINEQNHDKLLKLAIKRSQNNPIMGEVKEITKTNKLPDEFKFNKAIEIPGAFRVDGKSLVEALTQNIHTIPKTVTLLKLQEKGKYDAIIIATGARIPETLEGLDYTYDLFPQKGTLLEVDYPSNNFAIAMPKGEIDLLFKEDQLVIGATHINKFQSTNFDESEANYLIKEAQKHIHLPSSKYQYRIGLRSQNSKHQPFYGLLHPYNNVYIAGGLGSSGLTSGPIIGYRIAQHLLSKKPFNQAYSPNAFIKPPSIL